MTDQKNQLSAVKKTLKLASNLFELHPESINKCQACGQEKRRDAYYSFTLDAIKGKSDLYSRLSDIISDLAVGEELLPTTSGFFFGSTDYDQYYYQDIKETYEGLDKIIKEEETAEKQDGLFGGEYYYRASW